MLVMVLDLVMLLSGLVGLVMLLSGGQFVGRAKKEEVVRVINVGANSG